jgi:hypothetical protein
MVRPGWLGVAAFAAMVAVGGGCRQWPRRPTPAPAPLPSVAPPALAEVHPVTIQRTYAGLGMITARADVRGTPARVPCLTCHRTVPAKESNRRAAALREFHRDVQLKHGGQTCRTCHQVPGFTGFTLADGTPLHYEESMRLCRQCHANRLTEYEHGAHGGMTGYWDLTRGPRTRNHCLDCHNSHAPRIPPMVPAPRIRQRHGA